MKLETDAKISTIVTGKQKCAIEVLIYENKSHGNESNTKILEMGCYLFKSIGVVWEKRGTVKTPSELFLYWGAKGFI